MIWKPIKAVDYFTLAYRFVFCKQLLIQRCRYCVTRRLLNSITKNPTHLRANHYMF